ncbi:universal stress protein [Gordonia sp. CPCC 205515]|uniref:universal stress protein n=1 Tax=Gordonia sp. CPCC 205515 TaxID=3140791 RepID=UPI003AF3B508
MKLMVAYVATPGGADAVALGVRLARTLDAELEICVVMKREPADTVAPMEFFSEELTAHANEWVAEALAEVPEDVTATAHVAVHDSIAGGLIEECGRTDAVALIVGGSGGGLMGGLSLGSVVNELLHSSPVPVLLAPGGIRHSSVATVTGITCAVGELPGARALLDTAARACARGRLPLRVVSLVAVDADRRRGDQTEVRERARAHAEKAMKLVEAEVPDTVSVTTAVAEGRTIEDAVNALEWRDGEIILVGSSRLAAPQRLFLGSTAAKMMRVLAVPMAVVPKDMGR